MYLVDRQDEILAIIDRDEMTTASDIAAELGIKRPRALLLLRALAHKSGLIMEHKHGRAVSFTRPR